MSTHTAVVTVSIGAPLQTLQVPTVKPEKDEVRVRVEWTASSPLDLHQNDGGLLVTHPQILGDTIAGRVVEVGNEGDVGGLRVGDWIPDGIPPQEAVALPSSFVTVFHTATAELGLELPWPKPEGFVPVHRDKCILIWGGSSSVGQYAIQILTYYGYTNIITTASKTHHALLRKFGAVHTFDYRDDDITDAILRSAELINQERKESLIPFILDCIGSKQGSLAPLSKIAQNGARVAILLPVIVRDAGVDVSPEYSMDVDVSAQWVEGVETRGVRTHFYLDNKFFKEKLQPEIMPDLLAKGVVQLNRIKVVEGEALLERAQKALDALRRRENSGERLVWRVAGGGV
ncbi:hypothetical protein SS1G_09771 [Sclerotinia sclerotiorum 1980 UF-70]|uniref:Enoyl reductase (ER) domain-containing protein n=1 Tax=Sclerotinia sclerotiorum (strain ATCC 18683 / 1980 / Ss-1) TaxID=665079 RepID=A7EWR2_SCLS1|nr:hypothetical protein SS1G_09771 [Sclerotinia sclerotiorum 1980 UF-70]EDN93904.1 hypothetical protein SS1G_09771 [Sclerotinia sclerotiorum 1980 UF-70]